MCASWLAVFLSRSYGLRVEDARPLDELTDDLPAIRAHDDALDALGVHPIIQSCRPARARQGRKPGAQSGRGSATISRTRTFGPCVQRPKQLCHASSVVLARAWASSADRNTSWSAADPRRSPHSGPRQITILKRRPTSTRAYPPAQSLASASLMTAVRPGFVRGSPATCRSSSRSPGPPVDIERGDDRLLPRRSRSRRHRRSDRAAGASRAPALRAAADRGHRVDHEHEIGGLRARRVEVALQRGERRSDLLLGSASRRRGRRSRAPPGRVPGSRSSRGSHRGSRAAR